jgi:hypothetical protein
MLTMKIQKEETRNIVVIIVNICCVVDPDPVGSEIVGQIRIRIRKKLISDPGQRSTGSEMNLKENYYEKLLKFTVSQQKAQLRTKINI